MNQKITLIIFATFMLLVASSGKASADFYLSGTLTSTNLLFGLDVASIDSFWYNADVPAGTTLEVQFKSDGVWGTLQGLSDTAGVEVEIDLSGFGWDTANFYYRMEFTSLDGTATPTLESVRVDYSEPIPPYTPEKTMVDDSTSTGSGGGVVSAGSISFPNPNTDPLAVSARSWVVTDYAGVDFLTYSALTSMYSIKHTVTSFGNIVDSAVNEWVGGGPYIIDSQLCGLGKTAVVFVDGDLTISSNFGDAVSGDPLTFKNNCSSSLAFIVSGNISIDGSVNNIYGIFYAGGMIDTVTDGTVDSNPLYIFGSLLAGGSPTAFSLGRNLGAGNSTSPAEQIIYMPQYLITLKDLLGRSQVSWKEVKSP